MFGTIIPVDGEAFDPQAPPKLRQSVVEKIRCVLEGSSESGESKIPAPSRPVKTRRRRGRRSSPMSTRLLSIVRRRPGMTLDEFAVELYGGDGRTQRGRNRARALAWRLASYGQLWCEAGKYELPDGG